MNERNVNDDTSRITVLLPFHSSDEIVLQAVQSVRNQAYSDWSLLLLRDGAPSQIARRLASIEDERIRVIGDDSSIGLAARLNWGLAHVRTEYVARLDADDVMAPNRLTEQVEFLDKHLDVDAVGSSVYVISGNNEILGKREPHIGTVSREAIRQSNQVVHPSIAARTTWLQAQQYSPILRRTEDWDLWRRAIPSSNVANVELALTFYRISGPQTKYVIAQTHKEERALFYLGSGSAVDRTAMIAGSLLKECIKRTLGRLGLGAWIQRRTYQSIKSAGELQAASAMLESAIRVESDV